MPSWWKGRCQKTAAFGSLSSMTDGKRKAPQMILDDFGWEHIRTNSPRRHWTKTFDPGPAIAVNGSGGWFFEAVPNKIRNQKPSTKRQGRTKSSYPELRVAKVSPLWAASYKASSSLPQSTQVWDWKHMSRKGSGHLQPIPNIQEIYLWVCLKIDDLVSPTSLMVPSNYYYIIVPPSCCWARMIIHFNRIFHYKPSILGYRHLWKPPTLLL